MALVYLLVGLWLAGCTNVAQMQKKYAAGDLQQLDNLIEIVSRPDYPYATRKNAAHALGAIGNPKAVPVLIGVLDEYDRRTTLKEESIRALGAIGDPRAVDPIGRLLDRSLDLSDADLRLAALPVLGHLGSTSAAAILLRAMRYYDMIKLSREYNTQRGVFSGEEQEMMERADSLATGGRRRRGPPAGLSDNPVPTVSMFGTDMDMGTLELPDPTPEETALTRAALVQVGPPAMPAILECLATQQLSPSLRRDLEGLLAQLRPAAPDTVQTAPSPPPK